MLFKQQEHYSWLQSKKLIYKRRLFKSLLFRAHHIKHWWIYLFIYKTFLWQTYFDLLLSFYHFRFMGKPMPPEAMQKFLKGRVINGYKKLEEVIKRNGGDYILGSQITLADFYATVWCILPVDLGVLTLENNPTLSKWFEKVQEVKEIKNIRNKYQAMIKKIMFFLTWIMPIIKCCTCQCCCPKKK